ncbi:MAG: LLM class flavin-dependent oxidoreductase, partial [Deltaproteobacteria bacterium]
MKLDTTLAVSSFAEVAALAQAAEEIGFDALWSAEAQ